MMTQSRDNRAVMSPFLTIPMGWRVAIIAYFVVYQIFFPAVAGIFDPAAEGFLAARIALHSIRVLLTILPLLMYRKEYGFLHPIILPVLIATFESITKYPLSILNPISMPVFDYAVATNSKSASLVMPYADLAATRVWHEMLQIFGLVCYYFGYFVLNVFKVPKIRLEAPGGRLSMICAIGIALCVMTGLVFIQLQGGLVTHLLAMRGGRAALFAGQGQFLVISEFSVVIALVWFLYLDRPFQNPLWLACMAAASFTTLVIGGSRSSLILALVTLVLLWWRRKNRVLLVPTVTMAVISVLIISIFGSIRQDWGSKTINTSVFSVSAMAENFDRASREFEHRDDEEGDLAAFAGAKDGLLWGRSYLAAVSFVVPRAIWPDKPHGAGAYNMWVNFARQQMDDFGSKTYWGIPLGAVTEAYWNFWLPGVVIFIGLFGAFNRWLSDLVVAYPQKPIVLLFSVWMSTHFVGDPNSFINSVRSALLLIGLAMLLGILRVSTARGPRRGAPVRPSVGAGLSSS